MMRAPAVLPAATACHAYPLSPALPPSNAACCLLLPSAATRFCLLPAACCRALQADVWSWGILLFQLATWCGADPFAGLDPDVVRERHTRIVAVRYAQPCTASAVVWDPEQNFGTSHPHARTAVGCCSQRGRVR